MVYREAECKPCSHHHVFIRELETRKYFAKFMTKNLTPGQKANRKEVFCDLLEQIENDPLFLSNVIPRDEIYLFSTIQKPNTKPSSDTLQTHRSQKELE